jgi:hypothetical protein
VDGHLHHDCQKRDLQVSKKGNLTRARGVERAKRDARGIDLGCDIVKSAHRCICLSHVCCPQLTMIMFRL